MAELPRLVRDAIDALSLEHWRARKEAVTRLRSLAGSLDAETALTLAETLLDLLSDTDVVHARAAANEVLVHMGEVTVDPLLARLDAGGAGARLLVDLLGAVGDSSHAPRLVAILSAPERDQNLRASAATALGALGGEGAEAALTALLDSESEVLRTYALDGLWSLQAEVPVASLRPLLDNPVTRRGAAALLGRAGSDAVPLLIPLLQDPMGGVRAVSCLALARLESALSRSGSPDIVRSGVADLPPESRARVRELIGNRDAAVTSAAIKLAAMCRDVDALPDLLVVMDDPAAQERAMEMVMELGDAANAALLGAANEVETGRRAHFYRLVAAMRVEVVDPRLQARVTDGLEDPSEETAVAAAEALRFVGGRASMSALHRAMGMDGPLGEAAADALAEIVARIGGGRHDDLSLIVGTSWPQQGALARNLCRVAGKLGTVGYVPNLVSLLGSIDVGVRVAAASALGHIQGEHEGVGALSFALADEEAQVRASACRSLGMLRAPHSVQSLFSATNDPSPLVRAAAVQALVSVGNPMAVARYREIIADDPVPTVVVQAIAGLGASASEQDLTMLMSLCTSEDHEVVKAAARALGKFAAHRATAALLGLLAHERWDVRWAAAEVLAQRGDATALPSLRHAMEAESDALVRQVIGDGIERLEALKPPGRAP